MDHYARIAGLFNEIDAEVFSSDSLHSREGIELVQSYVLRWSNAIPKIKDIVKEYELNGDEDEE